MRKLFLIFVIMFSGCVWGMKNYKILVDKDLVWIIPKGVEFQAIQPPLHKSLTKIIAPEDLVVMYKGRYKRLVTGEYEKVEEKSSGKLGYFVSFLIGVILRRGKILKFFKKFLDFCRKILYNNYTQGQRR